MKKACDVKSFLLAYFLAKIQFTFNLKKRLIVILF